MRKTVAFLFALLVALPALAADAVIHAMPALWHVQGRGGDAWLFGSVHVMPPDIDWRTKEVTRALAKADVFVFELPAGGESAVRMQQLVVERGYLPPGESLRAKLDAAGQADYDAALAAAGLPASAVDRDRPWLASLHIMFAQLAKSGYSIESGIDMQLQKQFADKEQRFLETIDQQFALLAPADETLELNMFRSDLKDLAKADDGLGELVAAWSHGDVAELDRLMNEALAEFPDARAALLDDRNRRWVDQIGAMLREKHIFFITVGAGHLAGPGGVPALLRKAGYKVTGP